MAGHVPVATVLGCDPVSHRSCAVMVRGRSRIRYENTGEKYSPIIISAKQTLQTSQTISTATQQTNFLIRVDFRAVTAGVCGGFSRLGDELLGRRLVLVV